MEDENKYPGDIDTLIAEYWSIRDRADDEIYFYFSATGRMKGTYVAYLAIEHNNRTLQPLKKYTDNKVLQGSIIREFVNRHKYPTSQLGGFQLGNLVTCEEKLWGAYKATPQIPQFQCKMFDAIVIIQLESSNHQNYTELIKEYDRFKDDHPFKYHYLLSHAYVDGRKACIVVINIVSGDFTNFFKGILPLSATYAYLSGKKITNLMGPRIIEEIDLINYVECGSERNRTSYAVYTGKIMEIKIEIKVFKRYL